MKSMSIVTSWKERKQLLFENAFFETVKKWSYEDVTDDRRIAINTYKQVMEALFEMHDEPSVYVKVAMNKAMEESYMEIANIKNRFEK